MGQVSLEPKNLRWSNARGRVMLEDFGDCVLRMGSRPDWGGRRIWCSNHKLLLAAAGDFTSLLDEQVGTYSFGVFLDKTFIYKSSNTCIRKNSFLFCFALGMRLVHHFPMVCHVWPKHFIPLYYYVDLLLVFQHALIFALQFWSIF